ncbi:hypothetical protein K2173_021688 [Erythroxylum novogranatense]|uniref:BOD1/SHG1 domain-containing protein n=1 Tax=Erythroxylum novogranatense TaxID=1862640 RepID=A0AAV8TID4_9ROSI|nr:hypothetical protein K2173_021688 [Erythroxylum novogranatense]
MNGHIEIGKEKAKVSKEEVISKLKDDGDFDVLRLKIISKLKAKEELRQNILSIVRQSAALNQEGAEKMKPRQLSDAIFDEVGSDVMTQLSNGVWEIIRSRDGMKDEIAETVKSVYKMMVQPETKDEGKSFSLEHNHLQIEGDCDGALVSTANAVDNNLLDTEPKGPPGFSQRNSLQNNNREHKEELKSVLPSKGPMQELKGGLKTSDSEDVDFGLPPGFAVDFNHMKPCDGSDEDPDVPPGFG